MLTAFLIYVIRWAVVLTLLYSLYGLFMKRETLHGVNRVVLLLILAASMLLPLCQIETNEANIVMEGRELLEQQIASASTMELIPATQTVETPTVQPEINVTILVLIVIYLAGVVIVWARYLWSLAALVSLIRQSRQVEVGGLPCGVKVLTHPDIKTPCSWMRWILLSDGDIRVRPIVLHELAHVSLHHSLDMLLCELTCRTLWCVPFAWMLRQDLRDVHEYQADRRVLRSGIKDEEYQLLLIRKATGTGLQPVVNALNQSPIKRRFQMMYKKPSRRWVALKAAYLLPLSALSLIAFARPQALSEIEESVETEVTHYAAIVKPLVSDTREVPPAEEKEAPSRAMATDERPVVVTGSEPTDANLLKADLQENTEAAVAANQMTSEYGATVLDSVMQAVGARKIADGTFIGHFQPSLNNDTVRLAQVEFLDKESQKTLEQVFPQNANDPYAYRMTLQAGTRKGETGHYIRYLTPVKATDRNYDQPKYDPNLLPTDEVLISPQRMYDMQPVAIERTKKETRVFLFITLAGESSQDVAFLKNGERNIFNNCVICDNATKDKYVFRSMDDSYLRQVARNVDQQTYTYQLCLVFPPIDKGVRWVWIGNPDRKVHKLFNLKDIPRKGQVITN